MFDGLQIYQTRPNTIKYDQTRSNSTKQGVQTVKSLFTIKGLDKRGMFADQTASNVVLCLIVLNRVWSCLIKFEGHQTFDQKRKLFLLLSCLMGDVLFVWTAAYQTCFIRACVPRLLSGLYQLFDLCLIKHVFTVWSLTTLTCLVTKQCLMINRVWSQNISRLSGP